MADVDPIVVEIKSEFADLDKGLKSVKQKIQGVESETNKMGKGFRGTTDGMLGQVKKLRADFGALQFAVAGVTAGIGAFSKAQIQAALDTKRWANNLQIATSEMSELSAVARRFGGNTDDVGDAIKDLNERIADAATGTKTYEEALNRVGLSSRELINLPVAEQFIKVADAIGKTNNAGTQNFVTAELMSDAGFRLLGMFREGEDGIRAFRKEVSMTGEAMSSSQIDAFSRMGQNLNLVWSSASAAARNLAEFNKYVMIADGALVALNKVMSTTNRGFSLLKGEVQETAEEFDRLNTGVNDWRLTTSEMVNGVDRIEAAIKRTKMLIADLKNTMGDDFDPGGALESPLIARLKMLEAQLQAARPSTSEEADKITGASLDKDAAAGGFYPGAPNPEQQKEIQDLLLENMLDFQENQFVYQAEHDARMAEQHQSFRDWLFEIDKDAEKATAALWKSGWEGKAQITSKFLGQISGLMNTNSRKQFEIGKAAAIAQVAIDTPKAAMSAYSAMAGIPYIGPILGAAAAAATVAMGVSQIQNIKSQSFGGGGGVGGGSFDAGGGAAAGGQGGGAPVENVLDATFNIQGTNVSKDQIRALGGELNELAEDGFRLRTVNVI